MPRILDETRCNVRRPEAWTAEEVVRVERELFRNPAFGFHADGTPRWTLAEERLMAEAVFWAYDNCPEMWDPEPDESPREAVS